jgi:hypothetical protein
MQQLFAAQVAAQRLREGRFDVTTLDAITAVHVARVRSVAVDLNLPPRFFCRSHLDEPVTWRGTNCAACKHEAKNPRGIPAEVYS